MALSTEQLHDASVLIDFEHTEYAAVLRKLWTRRLNDLRDAVLCSGLDTFRYNQGRYDGARELLGLVERLTEEARTRAT
jgi:Mor family transcriptional regulator